MTDREKLIEAMARGMCEHVYPNCDFAPEGSAWVSTWAREREAFEEQATAALAAIETMGAVVVMSGQCSHSGVCKAAQEDPT
jgi:hypothetical protein